MAVLAAAANGSRGARAASRGGGARRGTGRGSADFGRRAASRLVEPQPNRIPRDVAEVIISGLSFSHRAGTARLACEQVFDARACAGMDWLAGKTGTPTFPNDDRSLSELARLCAPGAAKTRRDRRRAARCGRTSGTSPPTGTMPDDPRWTKVIGVLTERNWLADTGRVHGAGDHGPNPAAEIAMQIAGRHAGLLPRGASSETHAATLRAGRPRRACGRGNRRTTRVDVRRHVRRVPRRHRGHAAARDRAGRRRASASRC